MSRPRKTPAADAFAALGLTDQSVWTPAMRLAVKQKWSGLPTDQKVDVLRARLAAVKVAATPSADTLAASLAANAGGPVDDVIRAAAETEAARLKRNAGVTAWRERNQLQAALDARDLKFKQLRAKKQPASAAPADGSSIADDLSALEDQAAADAAVSA